MIVVYSIDFVGCNTNEVLPEPPKITDFVVISDIYARLANVKYMTRVVNEAKEGRETMFQVQFPKEDFISAFKMTIGNEVSYGVVKGKEEAAEVYNKARDEGKSAGQVTQMPTAPERDMDIFVINVNVAAESSTEFVLSYIEPLEMKLGQLNHRLYIEPGQEVSNMSVRISVSDPQGIASFSYKLPGSNEELRSSDDSKFSVYQASMNTHQVMYQPPESEQKTVECKTEINCQISITYEIERQNKSGIVIVNNNYFVHYFSPTNLQEMAKNIVFVIDISGSMGGSKIEAVRRVMIVILEKLRPSDNFNLLLFDDKIKMWKTTAVAATEDNIREAKAFAEKELFARGSTNINDALIEGINKLTNRPNSESDMYKSNIIVFLTDGMPTSGVTSTSRIRANVRRKNEGRANIYALGFGIGVNMEFLKALAWENGGFAKTIYVANDASEQLEFFYKEIESPLLKNLKMTYRPVASIHGLSETVFSTYRKGSEIVVVGQIDGNEQSLSGSIEGTGNTDVVNYVIKPATRPYAPEQNFAEHLWAYKTIKQYLKEMTITENITEYDDFKVKAMNLSIKYQFVTPLTSMVVTTEVRRNDVPSRGTSEIAADASFLNIQGQGFKKRSGNVHIQAQSAYGGNTGSCLWRGITYHLIAVSALHFLYRLIQR
ncbi:hypothetical protein FSP39_024826 [Pinctada imbricata]|uniref:Uncharacterized protein n=1 Tax=Pinctada imbricata TaxID=66713 RepID=A0AA88YVK0_PINIB|nr:hypothetical protein FSP39_024826 [Pinctada imbricata]